MKKIIFIIVVFIITFLIYYFNINKKIYYLSLGDYLSYGINNKNIVDNSYSISIMNKYKDNLDNYVNYSSIDDYRVMDLINDINYNKIVTYGNREYRLQNLLIKANLVTISIGMNDLIYKSEINYDYVDELLNDLNSLFELIRKYNKDKIYYLGFYNIISDSDIIEYINLRVQSICSDYEIKYVDISELNKYIDKGIYPTNEGYIYIFKKFQDINKTPY